MRKIGIANCTIRLNRLPQRKATEDVLILPANVAAHSVKQLVEDVNLPSNLKELGVKESDLETLADQSLTMPWFEHSSNEEASEQPRRKTSWNYLLEHGAVKLIGKNEMTL